MDAFYLTCGSAVGCHFAHRHSRDLDFFSRESSLNLSQTKIDLLARFDKVVIVSETDVALHTIVDDVPVDFVQCSYPPIQVQNSDGIQIASPLDLA